MTRMVEPMLNEFREEAAITKRVLDRVPADKLTWKLRPGSVNNKGTPFGPAPYTNGELLFV